GRHDRELSAGMDRARQVARVIELPADRDELFPEVPVGAGPPGQALHDRRIKVGAHARVGVRPPHHALDQLDRQPEFGQSIDSLLFGKNPALHSRNATSQEAPKHEATRPGPRPNSAANSPPPAGPRTELPVEPPASRLPSRATQARRP